MKLTRRSLLAGAAVVGGGLIVGVSLSGGPRKVPFAVGEDDFVPSALLQITPNDGIVFYCPRDEMGQGVTTGLTTLVAEELDVDPAAIRVELAGAHADYVNPDMGVQLTGGSNATKAHWLPLRQCGADARAAILAAAAARFGVPVTALGTDDGHVLHDGERYRYGTFAAAAAAAPLPQRTPLRDPADFRWIGRDFPRLDGIAKATGTADFGLDVEVPGQHYAAVVRSPVAGGTVRSHDASAVLGQPGVTDVVPVYSGIAVVARTWWQAQKAAKLLQVEWDQPALASLSTASLRADYARALDGDEGLVESQRGDLDSALEQASTVVEAEYWAPFLAHAPMEPMNATVRIVDGEADVWTGSQAPGAVQAIVARWAGLSVDRVRSHQQYMGGSFGRRGTVTHVIEATQAAMATGKPVQVVYSREDDMRHGLYRPASLLRMRAGVDDAGVISAWQAERAGGNFVPETLRNALPGLLPSQVPVGAIDQLANVAGHALANWVIEPPAVEGLFEDYDFPNRSVRNVARDHGLPLTFWRSVGHSYSAFAKESMIDELAHAANIDPVRLRLDNTRENPRLQAVIRRAAEHMRDWDLAPGRALGMAAHFSFGSHVAEVAEVSVTSSEILVHRVLCVVDCGRVVNPDIVRAQLEGAVMFALTATLHGRIDLQDGAVRQSNFHDYPILRMDAAPAVDVVTIDSDEAPTGIGEPGVPPLAPAVANAVFALTGHRLRELPLQLPA